MKKLWLAIGLAALAGVAVAQQQVQTLRGDGGVLWFDANSHAIISGHIVNTGQPPVLSACGTNPTIVGSDLAGTVTTGTATPAGCVITFNKAFSVAPNCVLGWASGPLVAMSWTTSTTAITAVQTATSSTVIQYVCFGKQ